MAEQDPIRQLQHLLDDPSNLLERISRIQSAIGSIREPTASPETSPPVAAKTHAEDPPFEDLLRMLRDMQAQIEERLRPLALQTIGTESERLRQLAKQEQTALDECLVRIDRSLTDCVVQIDASQKAYTDLAATHRRLLDLGAAAEALPEFPDSQDPDAFLQERIHQLRQKGKI